MRPRPCHLPLTRILVALLAFSTPAWAIILYTGDNTTNLTTPDTARSAAFASVGRIAGANRGSVVHIRGKYLLTANHVNISSNQVSFGDATIHELDTGFTPVQISGSDMKLIKLTEDPGLPETPLFHGSTGDTAVTATLIGWGVGRNPDVADSLPGPNAIWQWGASATMQKRWGTNSIEQAGNGSFAGYTYDYLLTVLDRDAGANEASATLFDSGSGLFVEHEGTWKLAGLTSAVSSINGPTESQPDLPKNSTFGTGSSLDSDFNVFVRIGSYAAAIEAAIPQLNTLSGWKIDRGLYGTDAANEADTDDDGLAQIVEFALGGDPNQAEPEIAPEYRLTTDGTETYLELVVTRPVDLQGITFTPMTTTDLSNWPTDSTGIVNPSPSPINNGNGSETLIYRRSQPVSAADQAFIRLQVSEI